ncbi:S9 family peptidase [Marinicauda sp. Alg238-R41]|uniref:S9 family peptidase n=1 Tax=Marinicauda sp. Alg238-R41 TaxID=2993447 RepID=UPI0022E573E4|nr:S9 family peptidase [Marinicauda sp. Alg238-R41]
MKTSRIIAGAAAGLALAGGAAAQAPLEIADLFEISQAGSAVLSPDGGHIAYTLSDPRNVVEGEENGPPDVHLWIGEAGGGARSYVSGHISVSDIAWRPGAGTVTFTAKRGDDEHSALYEIDPTGGEAVRLFAHDTAISGYVWGPQGETLYFVAKAEEDEEPYTDQGFNARVYEEDVEPAHLWTVQPEAGTEPEAEQVELDGHVSALSMSHSGDLIAVAIAPTPLIDDHYMNRRWHVVDTQSGEIRSTLETEGKTGGVSFSPDDRHLALIAGADRHDPTAGTLAIADVRSGEFALVARAAEQHIQDMAWIDDESVLALAHVGTASALVTYTLDGEETARSVQDDVVLRSLDGQAGASRFAATADAPTHPREAFFVSADGALERVHNHNEFLSARTLGDQQVFRFEARDGVEIEGVLITPPGDAPRGGWPLILTVHGGPEAHDSNGWLTNYSDPGHIGAGDGYAVFYPNYRGSTGRGEAFAKAHQNDYAGTEFNDLVDGVDALVEAGIVNRDRVGITGGSYGGYASMWGATALTEHFAASVAFVGISDQISKFLTTDIPNEAYLVHSREWPWEDWQNLLERSPIFHAGDSQTPTLILHGEDDTRVYPGQSLELYRSLKLRSDAPVRLIFYPGEGHGNRKAAAQFDYAHRMMRWFDHYLQGEGGEPPASDLPFSELIESGEDSD